MRVHWLVAGLLGGACVMPAWALDFAEAFRMAKDYDARVRIAASRAAQDDAGVDVAKSRLLPQVSAAAARGKQYTRTKYLSGPYPSRYEEPDTKNWALQVRQPLYRPAEWRSWERAQSLAEASARALDAETATLLSRVARAYLALLEAKTQLKVAEQDVARYTEVLRQAQRAFETGQGTRIEIEEAQARLDAAQASVVDWQGQIETGRQDLAALIGQEVNPEELSPFAEVRGVARDVLQEPVGAWVERTLLQNAELASLKSQLDAALKRVGVEKAGHLPTVDAVASRRFARSDSETTIGEEYLSTNVAVQVSIPLYSGGGVNASVRAALAARDEAQARFDGRRRELVTATTNAYSRVRFGLERVTALEQATRSAEQALVATRKGVQAGTRNNVDVLNAEQDVARAQMQWVSAAFELLGAIVELWAATGEVDQALQRLEAVQRQGARKNESPS
ncbi:TolC family outer membrane protein [Tepidiphilus olei]|uniref:TolC family outer membrane protein n=1 Tax=Tepidiphilus olei TaxID=2502184 RepID=UPI00115DBDA8|nr:TolC family outer membrane protein [Tepidiphilus olei]